MGDRSQGGRAARRPLRPLRAWLRTGSGRRFSERRARTTLDTWWLVALALIGAYVFVQSLGSHPLRNWDESIYANTARLMVQNGKWVIPHLYWHPQQGIGFQPFLEKPPLVLWLQGVSMLLFGVTRSAARVPSALFAIATGLLVYLFGSHVFDRRAGLASAVVVFTTPMIYAGRHGGRTGSTDVPLLFFGTLFVALTWVMLTEDRPDLFPYVGVAAALAVLSKGFAAGAFVIAVAPLALVHYRAFLTRQAALMGALTAGIVLPWPLYAWARYGHEFVYQIFLQQVLARATGSGLVSRSGALFSFMRYPYFRILPAKFDPWLYFLGPAIAVAAYREWQREGTLAKTGLLTWWAVSVFGLFVFTGNHPWYIMPMFVPCALLIGWMASAVVDNSRPALLGGAVGVLALFAFSGVRLSSVAVAAGFGLLALFPRLEAAAVARGFDDLGFERRAVPILVAAVLVAALVGAAPFGTSWKSYNREESLGRTVAGEVPAGEPVAIGPEPEHLFVFSFQAQRPLDRASIAELNANASLTYAVVANETVAELSRNHTIVGESRDYRVVRFGE